jgi:hypothetical protein
MHARDDGKLLDKNMEEILSYLRHFQAEVNGPEVSLFCGKCFGYPTTLIEPMHLTFADHESRQQGAPQAASYSEARD